MSDEPICNAVIGGSDLYRMPQLTRIKEYQIDPPFGKPSGTIGVGNSEGVRVAFLPRYGQGHIHLPSEVPYRANIFVGKYLA